MPPWWDHVDRAHDRHEIPDGETDSHARSVDCICAPSRKPADPDVVIHNRRHAKTKADE